MKLFWLFSSDWNCLEFPDVCASEEEEKKGNVPVGPSGGVLFSDGEAGSSCLLGNDRTTSFRSP